jgi:cell division septation protein DedD
MAERRSSRWTHGWPAIAAVGALVVAIGFAIGVVAGIGWQEPGLVVGYLTGQTEEIEWGVDAGKAAEQGELAADAAADEPPSVAAPPPLGQRSAAAERPARVAEDAAAADRAAPASDGDRAPRGASDGDGAPRSASDGERGGSTARSAPAPEARTAAQPSAAGFAVQVGAFSEKSAAEALASSLRARGYPVYLSPSDAKPASWRVRVGPMSTRPEAEQTARRLETAEKLPTWVLGEGA